MVESAGATSSADVLQSIAHLGVLPAGTDWAAARGAIHAQLAQVLAEFAAEGQAESAPMMEEDSLQVEPELTDEELCARLEEFEGPPFTIQRLCELLLEPRRHYRRRSKFAFACGKLLTVTDLIQLEDVPLSATMQAEVAERKAAVVAKDEEYKRRKAEDEAAAAAAAAAGEDGGEDEAAAAAAAEVAAEEKWMDMGAENSACAAGPVDSLASTGGAPGGEGLGSAAAAAAAAAVSPVSTPVGTADANLGADTGSGDSSAGEDVCSTSMELS